LRTIESSCFVTGVTWVDGELWHDTWEGEQSDIRHIDPERQGSGQAYRARRRLGVGFYAGGGSSGKVSAVRRPKRMR
jgi:hypothetical protein